jgi:hypothetical protein
MLNRLAQETGDSRLCDMQKAYAELDTRFDRALESFGNFALGFEYRCGIPDPVLDVADVPAKPIDERTYLGVSRNDAPY